ncbi:hypothetical protein [Microbulbifer sp. TRSA005]|uniref:hypothetical protein n=1 Tax=Microbulbifer sp. TRSA005 TaxID=3243383 RepID=UPI004039D042
MDIWEFVQDTHSTERTRRQILNDIILSSGKVYKTPFAICSVLFGVSLTRYFITIPMSSAPIKKALNINGLWVFLTLLSEFLSTIVLLLARKKYLARIQSDFGYSEKSLKKFDNGKLRYLKFKSKLRTQKVGKEDIENIKDTLEACENLAELPGTYAKILAKYIAALMIALLVTIAKTMPAGSALFTVICLGTFSYLIYQIAAIVPALFERVKELRYTLTEYQAELTPSPISSTPTRKELFPKSKEELE